MYKWLIPIVTFIVTFVACATTPGSGRKQLVLVPASQMNAMGVQAYSEILQQEKKSTDQTLTAKVLEIGQKIAGASGQDYKWEFNLFDNEQVNAFCLPGGKIGVYSGIIKTAKTNAGLAAILGHEVAHAVARHSAERVSQQMLVAGVLITADQAMRDSKYRQMILAGLGLGAQVGLMLPYSRKHESEADSIGLTYMAKAGYDPSEAVELWHRMDQLGGTPPEIISTHPDPLNRAKEIQAQLSHIMPIYEQSVKVPTADL